MNKKPRCLFITGTDTDVGKTYCGVKLLESLKKSGLSTAALKPVASGAERLSSGELRNEDALKLQSAASLKLPYEAVNPFVFEPAIAPHIAAKLSGIELSAKAIAETTLQTLQKYPADITIIEGAGGWLLPLNLQETMVDYLSELSAHVELEILLVVGMKLGCLNHTLLTVRAIHEFIEIHPRVSLTLKLNSPEMMPYLEENKAYLSEKLHLGSHESTIISRM
jgi:dethiobiotin synthetase